MQYASRHGDEFKLDDPNTTSCNLCGLTVLQSEAVKWHDEHYCSRECRNLEMQEMKPVRM